MKQLQNIKERLDPKTTGKRERKRRNVWFLIGSGLALAATIPLPVPGKVLAWVKWGSAVCYFVSGRFHMDKSLIKKK